MLSDEDGDAAASPEHAFDHHLSNPSTRITWRA